MTKPTYSIYLNIMSYINAAFIYLFIVLQNNALNIKGNQINDQTLNKILNISIELKKAIASGNVQTIEKRNKEHHLSMQKLIGICPYCNPNWHDVPNLPEAMKGYDVPNGNPDPGLIYFFAILNTIVENSVQ